MAKLIVDPEIRDRPLAGSGMAGRLGAIVTGQRHATMGVLLAAYVYL